MNAKGANIYEAYIIIFSYFNTTFLPSLMKIPFKWQAFSVIFLPERS